MYAGFYEGYLEELSSFHGDLPHFLNHGFPLPDVAPVGFAAASRQRARQRLARFSVVSRCDPAAPRRAATLRVAGAPEGCRFAAAGPNNVRQGLAKMGASCILDG